MKIHHDVRKLISQPNLIAELDFSRAKFYRIRDSDPTFPQPIKDGDSRQASAHYVVAEIDHWIEQRKAARGGV